MSRVQKTINLTVGLIALSVCMLSVSNAVMADSAIMKAPAAISIQRDSISPWALRIDSDSSDILRAKMMARYECFNQCNRQAGLLSYEGSTLWSRTHDLEVYGNVLYALNLNGLQIFDITDISNPILINKLYLGYATRYEEMDIDGNHLYVARNDRVYIFDITDPYNPTEISRIILSGITMRVSIENGYAYFGIARYYGDQQNTPALFIYDVSDPGNPSVVGKYESPYPYKDCRKFTVAGDYIYSINHWDGRMQVISIADKTRPVGAYAEPALYPENITHSGNLLFLAYRDTLKVYDISIPDSPAALHTYEQPTASYIGLGIYNGMLYYSYHDFYYEGFVKVFNINPDGSLDSIGIYEAGYPYFSVTFKDTLLFIPDGWQGFTIADNSNPANISTISTYSHRTCLLYGLDVESDHAYMSNYMSFMGGPGLNGLYTVDISDKQNPRYVNKDWPCFNPSDVFVMDTLAFIADNHGTRIYSLSNPADPVLICEYPDDYVQIKGNYARDTVLFATGPYSLDIVNIADPANPKRIFEFVYPGWYFDESLPVGQHLYTTQFVRISGGYRHYLGSWDISDISNPILENRLMVDTGNHSIADITQRGSYIYFAADGLHVIDISNPLLPDRIYHFLPHLMYPGWPFGDDFGDAVTARNYLFTSGSMSLQLFDLSDPEKPELIEFIPLPSQPEQIDLQGDYLHVATQSAYMIFKLNWPPIECGDANADGTVNISDAVYIINYIFVSGDSPDPYEAADVNCDGIVNVSDAVWIINYIFVGGNQPCDTNGDGTPDC